MQPTLVLSSDSRQKIELLSKLSDNFVVEPSLFVENNGNGMSPQDLAMYNAEGKAVEVAQRLSHTFRYTEGDPVYTGAIFVGADTVAAYKGRPLGKPADDAQVRIFLQKLSEQPHWVVTGLSCVDGRTGEVITCHESTLVHIPKLSRKEISDYIATGEPRGKAGAYAIQGVGSKYITDITGCYGTVVGLPVAKLRATLNKLGYEC